MFFCLKNSWLSLGKCLCFKRNLESRLRKDNTNHGRQENIKKTPNGERLTKTKEEFDLWFINLSRTRRPDDLRDWEANDPTSFTERNSAVSIRGLKADEQQKGQLDGLTRPSQGEQFSGACVRLDGDEEAGQADDLKVNGQTRINFEVSKLNDPFWPINIHCGASPHSQSFVLASFIS